MHLMGNNSSHAYFDLKSEISPENISHYGFMGGMGWDKCKTFFHKVQLICFLKLYTL